MTARRILSGLLLFLIAAAGLVLLKPDLFPDIPVPHALAAAPRERAMLGALLAAVAGMIVAGLAFASGRGAARPSKAIASGPVFGAASSAPVHEQTDGLGSLPSTERVDTERTWTPMPPLRVVETAPEAEPEPEPELELESGPPAEAIAESVDPAVEPAPEAPSDPQLTAVEGGPILLADEHAAETIGAPGEAHDPAAQESTADLQAAPGEAGEGDEAGAAPVIDPEASEEPAADDPAHERLAELLRAAEAAQAQGREADAVELYDAALDNGRAIHAAEPNAPAAQLALAGALSRIAVVEENDGRMDLALQHHEEALGLHRAVAAAAPGDADTAYGLVEALRRMADAREARGHVSRARDHCAEAVKLTERLAWLEPGPNRYADGLAAAKARHAELEAQLSPAPEPA